MILPKHSALWFSRGSAPVLLRNPIGLWFSSEEGFGTPCPPPLLLFCAHQVLNSCTRLISKLKFRFFCNPSSLLLRRHVGLVARKPVTKLDSNQYPQLQRLAGILKFRLKQVWVWYFPVIEQLRRWPDCAYAQAGLRLCRKAPKPGFLTCRPMW